MSANKTLMDKRFDISTGGRTKLTVSKISQRCRCERLLIDEVMYWLSSRSQVSRVAGVSVAEITHRRLIECDRRFDVHVGPKDEREPGRG